MLPGLMPHPALTPPTLFPARESARVESSLLLSVGVWLGGQGAVTSMNTLPSPLAATPLHKSQRDE